MAKKKKFRLVRKTQTLELTGDYEGGEVEINASAPMSFLFNLLKMGSESLAEQETVIRDFGDNVVLGWNFADADGNDIPADGDGMVALDSDAFNAIVTAWTERLSGGKNLEQPPSEPDTSV